MDIFATVITAGGIVYSFLDACASYSKEAKVLSLHLKYDLRVVEQVQLYFSARQAARISDGAAGVSQRDEDLLNETVEYLSRLAASASASAAKLEAAGFWWRKLNAAAWVLRRRELQELQRELHEWTAQFDIHLVGIPPELKTIIPAAAVPVPVDTAATATGGMALTSALVPPAILQSSYQMQRFDALDAIAKEQQVAALLRRSPSDELIDAIHAFSETGADLSSQPLRFGGQPLILATRDFPPNIDPESERFRRLVSDLGELAVALHRLDPAASVGLLRVEYYFYHRESRLFFFAQTPPYDIDGMFSLARLIAQTPYSHLIKTRGIPLSQRLRLAQKLAEAVFFLHTAGFVHKNITASSVGILEQSGLVESACFPFSLGDPFLMGFDMVRSENGHTVLEGTSQAQVANQGRSTSSTRWTFDVYQHPDRLQGSQSKRYSKNHDVYSLGVLLLEVGFWEPIGKVAGTLKEDRLNWPAELASISDRLGPRVGARYQRVVAWCLGIQGDYVIRGTEFAREVLGPLQDMASSMS